MSAPYQELRTQCVLRSRCFYPDCLARYDRCAYHIHIEIVNLPEEDVPETEAEK